jgi:putative phosphoribosyl transferase
MRANTIPKIQRMGVRIRAIGGDIPVDISVPENACGLVVFGDGVGSGRHSLANRRLAEILNERAFVTVVADLISDHEQLLNWHTGETCRGLDLLEQRVVSITDWIAMQTNLKGLPLGYFGAGIGADAALIAAAKRPETIRAVVSCEARLDQIEAVLSEIYAPALFIVGNEDPALLDRLRIAITRMPRSRVGKLEIIGWTTEPLQDAHALDRVASLTSSWYEHYLPASMALPSARARGQSGT